MWKRRTSLLLLFLLVPVSFLASQSQEGYPEPLVDYLESLDSAIAEWEALSSEVEESEQNSYELSKESFQRIVQDLIDSKRNERSALLGEQRAIELARSSQTTSEESFSALQELNQVQAISNIIGMVITVVTFIVVVTR